MRARDCLLYLAGNAAAARRIAVSRAALPTGLLLVLTAAIARRYDSVYLTASWTWWAGPLLVSLASSLFVFFCLRTFLGLRGSKPWAPQYVSFLGLFWMTAPCAWLYALPLEASLDPLTAAKTNLALLGLVAAWRVAILSRAVHAVTGIAGSLCLVSVLIPAAVETALLSFLAFAFRINSGLAVMGGLRNIDPAARFLETAHLLAFAGPVLALAVLAIAYPYIWRGASRVPKPFPKAFVGRAASAPTISAGVALGLWIALSIPFQIREGRLRQAQQLADQQDWASLITYLRTLTPEELPRPLRLPPDPHSWEGPYQLPAILEALPETVPTWIAEVYREHAIIAIQRLNHHLLSGEEAAILAAIFTQGDKIPRLPELLESHAPVFRRLLSQLCDPGLTAQFYGDPSDLLNLRFSPDTVVPIRYPILWESRRRLILHGMEQAMGPLPTRNGLPPFDPEIVETLELERYRRLTLRLNCENDDPITVYLYLPRTPETHSPPRRRPAVLALHPTHPLGKGVVDGQSEEPNRAYGRELAERGYIVLAPDYPSFGDSQNYDFEGDAYASGTMKGIFNHIRCVDYLVTRPDVDPARLGVIGHSLGGHNAVFAAAFDERLQVAVSSCGWTPFHYYYNGNLTGWTSNRYMPRIRDRFALDPNQIPFDFYGCIAAIAPRGFFSNSPVADDNFEVNGVRRAEPVIAKVYELYKARDRFQLRYPEAGHDFPLEVREESYRFIDSIIGPPEE